MKYNYLSPRNVIDWLLLWNKLLYIVFDVNDFSQLPSSTNLRSRHIRKDKYIFLSSNMMSTTSFTSDDIVITISCIMTFVLLLVFIVWVTWICYPICYPMVCGRGNQNLRQLGKGAQSRIQYCKFRKKNTEDIQLDDILEA